MATSKVKKAQDNNDPAGAETISEAQAEENAGRSAFDPNAPTDLRTGLATGSNAANPDQPDGHVTQTTVVPLNPEEPSTAENTVVLTADGKKGPAA